MLECIVMVCAYGDLVTSCYILLTSESVLKQWGDKGDLYSIAVAEGTGPRARQIFNSQVFLCEMVILLVILQTYSLLILQTSTKHTHVHHKMQDSTRLHMSPPTPHVHDKTCGA